MSLDTLKENSYSIIIGMGVTGYSVAQYLHLKNKPYIVFDSRLDYDLGDRFSILNPDTLLFFGELNRSLIERAKDIIVSPGVPLSSPALSIAKSCGKPVYGDIELFLKYVDKPVVGITGSNGKTTLTTLVGLALEAAGLQPGVGGNIGTPALSLLEKKHQIYVLELSSFQLDILDKGCVDVACILNISPDHLDRYATFNDYKSSKLRIYDGAQNIVFNLLDKNTFPSSSQIYKQQSFCVNPQLTSMKADYFLDTDGFIKFQERAIIHVDEILIKGKHNIENALALFSILRQLGLSDHYASDVLQQFKGLTHRCEWVANINGIDFINDSKATNIGATIAALEGLHEGYEKIILIAGGDGKGADFRELSIAIEQYASTVILFGKDADNIQKFLPTELSVIHVNSLKEATDQARLKAHKNDLVLFSPACASLDMFENYQVRGEQFKQLVREAS